MGWLEGEKEYANSFARLYRVLETAEGPSPDELGAILTRNADKLLDIAAAFPPHTAASSEALRKDGKVVYDNNAEALPTAAVDFVCGLARDHLNLDARRACVLYHFHAGFDAASKYSPESVVVAVQAVLEERRCRAQAICSLLRVASDDAHAYHAAGRKALAALVDKGLRTHLLKELMGLRGAAAVPPAVPKHARQAQLWVDFTHLHEAALVEALFLLHYAHAQGSCDVLMALVAVCRHVEQPHALARFATASGRSALRRARRLAVLSLVEAMHLEDAVECVHATAAPGNPQPPSHPFVGNTHLHAHLSALHREAMAWAEEASGAGAAPASSPLPLVEDEAELGWEDDDDNNNNNGNGNNNNDNNGQWGGAWGGQGGVVGGSEFDTDEDRLVRSVVLLALASLVRLHTAVAAPPRPALGDRASRASSAEHHEGAVERMRDRELDELAHASAHMANAALHLGALHHLARLLRSDTVVGDKANVTAYKCVCNGLLVAVHHAFAVGPFSPTAAALCRAHALTFQNQPLIATQLLWACRPRRPSPLDLAIAAFPLSRSPLLSLAVSLCPVASPTPGGGVGEEEQEEEEGGGGGGDEEGAGGAQAENARLLYNLVACLPSFTWRHASSSSSSSSSGTGGGGGGGGADGLVGREGGGSGGGVQRVVGSDGRVRAETELVVGYGLHAIAPGTSGKALDPSGCDANNGSHGDGGGTVVQWQQRWDAWPLVVWLVLRAVRAVGTGHSLSLEASDEAAASAQLVHGMLAPSVEPAVRTAVLSRVRQCLRETDPEGVVVARSLHAQAQNSDSLAGLAASSRANNNNDNNDESTTLCELAYVVACAVCSAHNTVPPSLHLPLVSLLSLVVRLSPPAASLLSRACVQPLPRASLSLPAAMLRVACDAAMWSGAGGGGGGRALAVAITSAHLRLLGQLSQSYLCAFVPFHAHSSNGGNSAALSAPASSSLPSPLGVVYDYVATVSSAILRRALPLPRSWRWRVLGHCFRTLRQSVLGHEGVPVPSGIDSALLHAVTFPPNQLHTLVQRGHHADVDAMVQCVGQAVGLLVCVLGVRGHALGARVRSMLCSTPGPLRAIVEYALDSSLPPAPSASEDLPFLSASLLSLLCRPSPASPSLLPLASVVAADDNAASKPLDVRFATAIAHAVRSAHGGATPAAVAPVAPHAKFRANALLEVVHAALAHQPGLVALLLQQPLAMQGGLGEDAAAAAAVGEGEGEGEGKGADGDGASDPVLLRTLWDVVVDASTPPLTLSLALGCLRLAQQRRAKVSPQQLPRLCSTLHALCTRYATAPHAPKLALAPEHLRAGGSGGGGGGAVDGKSVVMPSPSYSLDRCHFVVALAHVVRMVAVVVLACRKQRGRVQPALAGVCRVLPSLLRSLDLPAAHADLVSPSSSLPSRGGEDLGEGAVVWPATEGERARWLRTLCWAASQAEMWQNTVLGPDEAPLALGVHYAWSMRVKLLPFPPAALAWLRAVNVRVSCVEAQALCLAAVGDLLCVSREVLAPLPLASSSSPSSLPSPSPSASSAATAGPVIVAAIARALHDSMASSAVRKGAAAAGAAAAGAGARRAGGLAKDGQATAGVQSLGVDLSAHSARLVEARSGVLSWALAHRLGAAGLWGARDAADQDAKDPKDEASTSAVLDVVSDCLVELREGRLRSPEHLRAWRRCVGVMLVAFKSGPQRGEGVRGSPHALLSLVASCVVVPELVEENCAALGYLLPHCSVHTVTAILTPHTLQSLLALLPLAPSPPAVAHAPPLGVDGARAVSPAGRLCVLDVCVRLALHRPTAEALVAADVFALLTHSLDGVLFPSPSPRPPSHPLPPYTPAGDHSWQHTLFGAVLRVVTSLCITLKETPDKFVGPALAFVQAHHTTLLLLAHHAHALSCLPSLHLARLVTRLALALSPFLPRWLALHGHGHSAAVHARFGPRLPVLVQQCIGLLPGVCELLLHGIKAKGASVAAGSVGEERAREVGVCTRPAVSPSPSPSPSLHAASSPSMSPGGAGGGGAEPLTPPSPPPQSPQTGLQAVHKPALSRAILSLSRRDIPPPLSQSPPCPSTPLAPPPSSSSSAPAPAPAPALAAGMPSSYSSSYSSSLFAPASSLPSPPTQPSGLVVPVVPPPPPPSSPSPPVTLAACSSVFDVAVHTTLHLLFLDCLHLLGAHTHAASQSAGHLLHTPPPPILHPTLQATAPAGPSASGAAGGGGGGGGGGGSGGGIARFQGVPLNPRPTLAVLFTFQAEGLALLKKHFPNHKPQPHSQLGGTAAAAAAAADPPRLTSLRAWLVHDLQVALAVTSVQLVLAYRQEGVSAQAKREMLQEVGHRVRGLRNHLKGTAIKNDEDKVFVTEFNRLLAAWANVA